MTMNADQSEALEARMQLRRTDPRKAFEDTMTELFRTQERLQSVRTKLKDKPTKINSKDGMITVTLDERGEATSISFNTAKWRRMAPAELGSALVEVISRARAEGRKQVISAYRQFLPEGTDIEKIMSGKLDMESMLRSAKLRGEQILAEAERPISLQTSRPGEDKK
jgi:DNA-binding protein YbaB